MELRTQVDDRGRMRIVGPELPPLVRDFLETDVREDPGACRRLLEEVSECRKELRSDVKFAGNLYLLEVDAQVARISNLFDERVPTTEIPAAELEEILEAWCRAVDRRS